MLKIAIHTWYNDLIASKDKTLVKKVIKALTLLKELVGDESGPVSFASAMTLVRMGVLPGMDEDIALLLDSSDDEILENALIVLASLRSTNHKVLDKIQDLLGHANPRVSEEAAVALASSGTDDLKPYIALERVARNPNQALRVTDRARQFVDKLAPVREKAQLRHGLVDAILRHASKLKQTNDTFVIAIDTEGIRQILNMDIAEQNMVIREVNRAIDTAIEALRRDYGITNVLKLVRDNSNDLARELTTDTYRNYLDNAFVLTTNVGELQKETSGLFAGILSTKARIAGLDASNLLQDVDDANRHFAASIALSRALTMLLRAPLKIKSLARESEDVMIVVKKYGERFTIYMAKVGPVDWNQLFELEIELIRTSA